MSYDLWFYWRRAIEHDDLNLQMIRINAALILRQPERAEKCAETITHEVIRLENVHRGLLAAFGHDTLQEALFATSWVLNRTFDVEISPDCAEYGHSRCDSMPIILMMLLKGQARSSKPEEIFVDVSCTSSGYRIFIAPNRMERGTDWPDVTLHESSQEGWLDAVASELAKSGHSFTVRSNGSLSTFSIVYPRTDT